MATRLLCLPSLLDLIPNALPPCSRTALNLTSAVTFFAPPSVHLNIAPFAHAHTHCTWAHRQTDRQVSK